MWGGRGHVFLFLLLLLYGRGGEGVVGLSLPSPLSFFHLSVWVVGGGVGGPATFVERVQNIS